MDKFLAYIRTFKQIPCHKWMVNISLEICPCPYLKQLLQQEDMKLVNLFFQCQLCVLNFNMYGCNVFKMSGVITQILA